MTRRFPLCLAVAACLALPGCATVMGDVRPFDRVAPSPYDTHPAMAAQAHPHAVAPAAAMPAPAYAAAASGIGRDFAGVGNSTQANQLDGDITVTVVRNLGNGNLLVSGEKMMRLNQGDELVQVQGIVRVADIGPDNRIPSNRVGEARIVYGGRGTLARSNAMGWLGRFFNSAAFPY